MEEIGEAFVRIHADTTSFRRELDTQVAKALAAAEKSLGKVKPGSAGGKSGSAAVAQAKQAVASAKQVEKASNKISDTYVRQGKEATNAAKKVRDAFNDQFVEINKANGALDKLRKASAKAAAQELKDNEKVREAFNKLYQDVQGDARKASTARAKAAADAAAKEIADNQKIQEAFNNLYRDVQLDANKASAARAKAAADAAAKEIADNEKVREAFNKLYLDVQSDALKAAAARERASAKAAAAEIRDAEAVRAANGRINDAIIRNKLSPGSSSLRDLKMKIDTSDLTRAEAAAAGTALRIRKRFEDAGREAGRALAQGIKIGLAGVALTGAAAGGGLAFFGVKQAAAIEQARFQFENLAPQIDATKTALVGAVQVGKEFSDQLIDISNKTSISFDALSKNVTALLATGQTGEQAIATVKDFANAAAAAGQSGTALDESVQGAVRAFTQIQGKGKLAAQELNQIADQIPSIQRINIYKNIALQIQELAKNKNASKALKDIAKQLGNVSEKGQLSSKQLNILRKQLESNEGVASGIALPALQKAVQEVNGANGALDKQGKTLAGRLESIRDTFKTTFGKAFLDNKAFQGFTDQLGKLIDSGDVQKKFAGIGDSLANSIGPALEKALPKILDALPGLADSIGKIFAGLVKGAIAILPIVQKVFEFFAKISDALTGEKGGQFFSDLKVIIAPILDQFKTFLALLSPVAKIIAEVVHQLVPLFKIVNAITAPLGVLARGIINIFNNEIVVKITAFVLQLLAVEGIFAAVGKAVVLFGERFAALSSALKVEAVFGKLATVSGAVGKTFGKLLEIFQKLPGPVQFFINKLTEIAIPGRFLLKTLPEIGIRVQAAFLKAAIFVGKFAEVLGKIPVIGRFIEAGLKAIAGAMGFLSASIGAVVGILEIFIGLLSKIPGFGTVVNGIKSGFDHVGGAIKSAGGFLKGLVSSGDKLPRIGAHAKEISGQFLVARRSVADLSAEIGRLDALPDTVHNVLIKFSLIGQQNAGVLNSLGVPLTGLEDATGFSTEGIQAAAKAQAKRDKAAQKLKDDLAKSFGGGGGGGGGGGKSAAQTAADNFRESIREILKNLDKDFKSGLVAGDAKNAKDTLVKLRRSIIEAFAEAGKDKPSKLVNRLNKDNKKLQKLLNQRDGIIKRLEAADEAFKSAFEGAQSFADITDAFGSLADSVDNAAGSLADLSRLRIIKPGQDAQNLLGVTKAGVTQAQQTAAQLDKVLKDRLAALTKFNNDIKAVIAKGLNRESVQQLIEAGVSGGGAAAAALAQADSATIQSINSTQKAIDAQAKQLGSIAGDAAASIGENVILGMVAGLKKQKGALVDSITALVDTIVKRIKKGLAIKSPSRVMMWMGQMVGAGLGKGIRGMVNHVGNAASKLVDAATVSVPDVALPEIRTPDIRSAIEKLPTPSIEVLAKLQMDEANKALAELRTPAIEANQLRDARQTATPVSQITHNRTDSRTVQAPITNHFHGVTDPDAAAKMVAARINGIVKGAQ